MSKYLPDGSAGDFGHRRPLASPSDLAEFTGGSVQTLAVWRMKGEGPRFIKMGRSVRYRWEDIDAWIDAQAAGGRS